MERLVYQPDCGCQVYRIMHSKPNLYRIQYCPLHKSAPDLYKACKGIAYMWRKDTPAFQGQLEEAKEELSKAIAKAEGK